MRRATIETLGQLCGHEVLDGVEEGSDRDEEDPFGKEALPLREI